MSSDEKKLEHLECSLDLTYNWGYEVTRQELRDLYKKAQRMQWNPDTTLPWQLPVDLEKPDVPEELFPLFGSEIYRKMTQEEKYAAQRETFAWVLSQFLHGEQGAMLAAAQLVSAVPMTDGKYYASTQVFDEGRHVEVYDRYLHEKIGWSYPISEHLKKLLDLILKDVRWDMKILGMQIMVEGLALAAFGLMRFTQADEPLIQQITHYVMRDEARHVAFGVLSLEKLYTQEMSSTELKEREDFVIEATMLMRDRLLMEEVWPRLGLDPKVWMPWSLSTPFMVGFRQILFSKIVPNLKRLGLLTPRVREKYRELGILDYEFLPDSTQEEETPVPPALLQFFANLQAAGVNLPWASPQ